MSLRIAFGASMLSLLVACNSRAICDLPAHLRNQAGEGAIDCGHADVDDTAKVDECVVAAFGQGLAFFAQYDLPGEDSRLTLGISRDAAGEVMLFQLDDNPSGGSTKSNEVIESYTCEDPKLDPGSAREPPNVTPVACTRVTSLGRSCG